MSAHGFGDVTIMQEFRGLETNPFSEHFDAGWVVYGTEGIVAAKELPASSNAKTSLFDPDGNHVRIFDGPSQDHFANFIKAVRSGKREDLNADIIEGHQSSAVCHVGNVSYRLGRTESARNIAKQLEDHNLHDDLPKTFARMTSHMEDHGVDLEKTHLTVGPLLRVDSDREVFVDRPDADALLSREYRKPFVVPGEHEI